jgi:hypothetical protein
VWSKRRVYYNEQTDKPTDQTKERWNTDNTTVEDMLTYIIGVFIYKRDSKQGEESSRQSLKPWHPSITKKYPETGSYHSNTNI